MLVTVLRMFPVFSVFQVTWRMRRCSGLTPPCRMTSDVIGRLVKVLFTIIALQDVIRIERKVSYITNLYLLAVCLCHLSAVPWKVPWTSASFYRSKVITPTWAPYCHQFFILSIFHPPEVWPFRPPFLKVFHDVEHPDAFNIAPYRLSLYLQWYRSHLNIFKWQSFFSVPTVEGMHW